MNNLAETIPTADELLRDEELAIEGGIEVVSPLSVKDRNELVMKNKGLVYYFARKFYMHSTFEDRVQEAYLGLLRAADMYEPSRGPFGRYAGFWIRGYLHDLSDRERKYDSAQRLLTESELDFKDSQEPIDITTVYGGADTPTSHPERRLDLENVLHAIRRVERGLSPIRKHILVNRLLSDEEETLQDIAGLFGLNSREGVRQHEMRLIKDIREELGDDDN